MVFKSGITFNSCEPDITIKNIALTLDSVWVEGCKEEEEEDEDEADDEEALHGDPLINT